MRLTGRGLCSASCMLFFFFFQISVFPVWEDARSLVSGSRSGGVHSGVDDLLYSGLQRENRVRPLPILPCQGVDRIPKMEVARGLALELSSAEKVRRAVCGVGVVRTTDKPGSEAMDDTKSSPTPYKTGNPEW